MNQSPSRFYDLMEGLSTETAARLVSLYQALVEGLMTPQEFLALASALVARANVQAYTLADLSLAAAATAATRRPVAALGVAPPADDLQRIVKGLRTLLEAEDDVPMRIERYGRSEPANAAQDGYVEAMRRRGIVEGYVRVLNPGACELCYWLWKEGYVYPKDKSFHRHTGCMCYPQPVFDPGVIRA